ncbi:MAG TPA: hypothetical protein P5205_02125 [Candidatus Paceibacterota bacterium]|nr:hypothetical protein [Verrucomicrobiota bacterium]HSA09144.1 hypothetical protein [Candidatus Paceibacterota bacterium]
MRSTLRCGLGLSVVALGAAAVCTAYAGSRQQGRRIEFSEPKSFEVMTNLQQLATKKDGLKHLEEDLYKPLQTFTPKSSLDGVAAPLRRTLAPSAIQSKRVKELLERRKDWVFMTPEDLLAAPTVEQILKTPESEERSHTKEELLPMERYYQRLVREQALRVNPALEKDNERFSPSWQPNAPEAASAKDEMDLPSGLKESAEALMKVFESGKSESPFGQDSSLGSLSDPFGLARKERSKDQVLQHKRLMDEYRTIVDPTWRPPTAANALDPALALAGPAPTAGKPSAGLPSVSNPALRNGTDVAYDVLNPVLGPSPLPDVNAQAVGQTRSTAGLPKVQERRVIPRAPDFTAPKRPF